MSKKFLQIKKWLNRLEGMSDIESEREVIDPGDQKRSFINSLVRSGEDDPKGTSDYKKFIERTYKDTHRGPLTADEIKKKVKR